MNMQIFLRGWLVALIAVLAGCATGPAPRVLRASELQGAAELAPGQPLIIEFQPGDSLPLEVALRGPLLQSAEGAQPIRLVAKQRFFLRLDGDGIATSLDGKDFSADSLSKGSMQFGIGASRERGAHASLTLAAPSPQRAD
jgi:hypothetical protein